jgi:hypothetical protein
MEKKQSVQALFVKKASYLLGSVFYHKSRFIYNPKSPTGSRGP